MFVAALHQPHSSPATHGQRQPAFGKFAISLPKENANLYHYGQNLTIVQEFACAVPPLRSYWQYIGDCVGVEVLSSSYCDRLWF